MKNLDEIIYIECTFYVVNCIHFFQWLNRQKDGSFCVGMFAHLRYSFLKTGKTAVHGHRWLYHVFYIWTKRMDSTEIFSFAKCHMLNQMLRSQKSRDHVWRSRYSTIKLSLITKNFFVCLFLNISNSKIKKLEYSWKSRNLKVSLTFYKQLTNKIAQNKTNETNAMIRLNSTTSVRWLMLALNSYCWMLWKKWNG